MVGKIDTKIFGAYDITNGLVRIHNDIQRYQKFLDKPVLLKGLTKKLAVDVDGYKKGLSCILSSCDEPTLKRFEKTMKNRYPEFDIKGLINELVQKVPEKEK